MAVWWGWSFVALGLLMSAPATAGTAIAFQDGGDRRGLHTAAVRARDALPKEDPRRGTLDALLRGLSEGRSIDEIISGLRASEAVEILLTGYYEPLVDARREHSARFRYPLYRPPDAPRDRVASRATIDGGALAGQGLEIFWLDDPVEAFFLHVQGSGRLKLETGRTARVGYAANNGQEYHSIGSELVSRGEMTVKQATAPTIKKWLRDHPDRIFEVLHTNPRYIYFREVDAPSDLGPSGAMGVPLVPFRSVATDPVTTPMGTVGLLSAPMPDGSMLQRVVVAMDKGAAIRGEKRIDLFTGAGGEAERLAGVLRARGRVTWLGP